MPLSNPATASPEKLATSAGATPAASNLKRGLRTVIGYVLIGVAGSLILSLVELSDATFRFRPYLESPAERFVLVAYCSINLLGGALTGLAAGVAASLAATLFEFARKIVRRWYSAGFATSLASFVMTSGLFAVLLNQHSRVHAYVIAQIREAEKFHSLNTGLLNHERAASYAIMFLLFASSWLLVTITKRSISMSRPLCNILIAVLLLLVVAVYWADSTVLVDLYENSLHRSLFLLDTALSMALAGAIYQSSESLRAFPRGLKGATGKLSLIGVAALLWVGAVGFTFWHIDKDQNLKALLFYRTIETRAQFQLVQWALDFDRDGYSSLLGGGDANDRDAGINPASVEIAGDGIDNNCIGGDLTRKDISDWHQQFQELHRPPSPDAKRLNVIFIFIDALRPDHLGTYGYTRGTSPNIDRLAERSQVFENAFTAAPNTFESMPKFMKSCYWDERIPSWTEVLANGGYDTMLFPRRTPTLLRWVKGVKRIYKFKSKSLDAQIDSAIKALDTHPKDQPFCAYIYCKDVHRPYSEHPKKNFGPSTADLYDSEIAYSDFHFGRLFDSLDQNGHMKDTMIVIMADHGEALGERRVYGHSTELSNEQARVPMIIYMPGMAPRRIRTYVTLVDLGVTILSAAGLDFPQECTGVSLIPLMRGEPISHPPIYAEQTSREDSPYVTPRQQVNPVSKKYMIVTQDGYKLIYDRNYYCFELYDLNRDPHEFHNLYSLMPDRAELMKKMIGRYVDVVSASRPWDADERQYFFGPTEPAKSEEDVEGRLRLPAGHPY
ncbi:MAG TPA: sulfatase-like hydrolase/transferase [Blastocatellia bacterium]|nr:sulfatase-like hydrolase/transferase [Blastocatellia bacterium]